MSKKPSGPSPESVNKKNDRDPAPDLFKAVTKPTELEELTRYGIKRVPVDYFHFGDFRYSNAADAIAQAKRGCKSLSPVEEAGDKKDQPAS